jgi:hypothetical protein
VLKRVLPFLMFSLLAVFVGFKTCRQSDNKKGFTEKEISEIEQTLKGLDPAGYRIVLPQIENGRTVGSKTYGSLPVTEARRLASLRNIAYVDNGNVQAIYSDADGGAGSHTQTQSQGNDIGKRIERILQNIDKSKYVLIH